MGRYKPASDYCIEKLNNKLKALNINGVVVDSFFGPVLTRYEIKIAISQRIGSVLNLERDIKTAFGCVENVIITQTDRPHTVIIDVPHTDEAIAYYEKQYDEPTFKLCPIDMTDTIANILMNTAGYEKCDEQFIKDFYEAVEKQNQVNPDSMEPIVSYHKMKGLDELTIRIIVDRVNNCTKAAFVSEIEDDEL